MTSVRCFGPIQILIWVGLSVFSQPSLFAQPAQSQQPQTPLIALHWPVDCTLGETCFLQQYVDHDPGPGAQDYTCGPLSYDTHTGTDIRVADLVAMEDGALVTAAADGTVTAIRDEIEDAYLTPERREALAGKGCGNGVVVAHRDGWQTQYCHLKLGSITVQPGDQVRSGTPLGQIGLSGFTDFPHLELIVRKDGEVMDPFAPTTGQACGNQGPTLWSSAPDYQAGGFLRSGFATDVPDFQNIKEGRAALLSLASDDPALVLWGYAFGVQDGDRMTFAIDSPTGQRFFEHSEDLTRTQAEVFRAAGQRGPAQGWPAGTYTGTMTLIRDGVILDQSVVQLPAR